MIIDSSFQSCFEPDVKQLLRCTDLLLFFIISDSKLKVLGFWTVGWTEEDVTSGSEECDENFSHLAF